MNWRTTYFSIYGKSEYYQKYLKNKQHNEIKQENKN